jgi:hypothetical protein
VGRAHRGRGGSARRRREDRRARRARGSASWPGPSRACATAPAGVWRRAPCWGVGAAAGAGVEGLRTAVPSTGPLYRLWLRPVPTMARPIGVAARRGPTAGAHPHRGGAPAGVADLARLLAPAAVLPSPVCRHAPRPPGGVSSRAYWQISDADCLIRLDIFRAAAPATRLNIPEGMPRRLLETANRTNGDWPDSR